MNCCARRVAFSLLLGGLTACGPDIVLGTARQMQAHGLICSGANPQGCSADAQCGASRVCRLPATGCISSACHCDGSTGAWSCTPDCGGGECVDPAVTSACAGANPQGCQGDAQCGAAQRCDFSTGGCHPSACECDTAAKAWTCTPDCNGGRCVDR